MIWEGNIFKYSKITFIIQRNEWENKKVANGFVNQKAKKSNRRIANAIESKVASRSHIHSQSGDDDDYIIELVLL